MSKQFRPMLAATLEPEQVSQIQYPVLASPKLDGIRCLIRDGVAVSRSLKPIPNAHVQRLLARSEFEGLDGELIVGSPTAEDCYRKTNSGVMSQDGEPDFRFHVFDTWNSEAHISFETRHSSLGLWHGASDLIQVVPHEVIAGPEALLEYEATVTSLGFEGVMLRSLNGPYKQGRSTLREGWLLKLKRFLDAEAVIIGFEELLSNQNEATKNALGHTERSSHKANLVPMGVLGAVQCRTPEGIEFSIGSGFTAKEREELWSVRDSLPGQLAKYKFFPVGVKEAPRFPTFLGIRSREDL